MFPDALFYERKRENVQDVRMEWKVSEDFVYDSAHSREGRQSIYRRKTHKKYFYFQEYFIFVS